MGKKMLTYAAGGIGGNAYGKISLKHQNLLQDYHELERETDSMRTKLEFAKQRKRSLLAEVSFLRRRYKYLSSVKTENHVNEQEPVARVSSGSQNKLSSENRISKKKGARLHQLPPLPNLNHRGRMYSGKEAFQGNIVEQRTDSALSDLKNKKRVNNASKKLATSQVAPVIDLNIGKDARQQKRKSNSSKKAVFPHVAPVIDLNLTDRMHIGNDVAVSNTTPLLDLNQDSSSLGGTEIPFSSRVPTFDLNEISTAEEDMQSNSAPLEELKKSLMRAGTDDQFNHDLMVSMCRNTGEGPSRVGKRKISWQDPVALRV